jgi:hypothetical protein
MQAIKLIGHLLAGLYLVLSLSGFQVQRHYCGERLVQVAYQLGQAGEPCCGNAEEPMNCCHDETKRFELESAFTTPALQSFQAPQLPVLSLACFKPLLTTPLYQAAGLRYPDRPPPRDPAPPTLTLLLQVFRI